MDQNQTKEPRPPINLRIKFRSENVEQFIERYAVDVSRGGIFIRTRDPLAVGTHLKLDFQFQNGSALMAGEGTVVWIREFDPNRTTVPPGMGVRFDKLSPESQVVLEQLLVEKGKREKGGIPGSTAGTGGIAVRRPSSMFSVLEPQVSVAEGVTNDKATATTTTATAATSSAAAADKSGPVAGKTETPGPAYRPLGTARNPFSSPTTGGTPGPTPTSPVASTSGSGPRPLADLLPLLSGTPKAATPSAPLASGTAAGADPDGFDDMNEEPTQIAGRLPSFLTSDSEATTEVPTDLAESVRTAAPLPLDFLPGASPDSARPGARAKQSLDEAPPVGRAAEPASLAPTKTEEPKPEGEAIVATPSTTETSPVAADAVAAPAAAPAATTAAKPETPAKKRSAMPVVVAVVVLGASAIFLTRFFGSQSSQDVTHAPSAPAALPTVTGEPAAPPAPPPGEPAAAVAATAPPAAAEAPAAAPVAAPAEVTAEAKPAAPATPEAVADAPRKPSAKKKARAEAPAPEAEAGTAAAAGVAAPPDAEAAPIHQIRVTSKPNGADVTLDGQGVGKTPFTVGIADVNAPHSIAVRKDGFEPFEQAITPSSAWSKSKTPKGKPPLMVLKLNAKLKPVGGAAEAKAATEPPAAQEGDPAAAKPDRPLPPTDVPPSDSPPPP